MDRAILQGWLERRGDAVVSGASGASEAHAIFGTLRAAPDGRQASLCGTNGTARHPAGNGADIEAAAIIRSTTSTNLPVRLPHPGSEP